MFDLLKPMEDGRYLNLDGSDVHAVEAESKLQSAFQKAVGFLKRPEVVVPFALIFGAATQVSQFSSLDLVKAVTLTTLTIGASDLMVKGVAHIHLQKKSVIDRKEDKSVSKPEALYMSKKLSLGFTGFAILGLTAVSFDLAVGTNQTLSFFKQSQPINDQLTKIALLASPVLHAYRFSQVARGKWNIVDEPPKKQRREEKSEVRPNLLVADPM